MTPVKFLDVKSINLRFKDQLKEEFSNLLDSGNFVLGDSVRAFEKEFATYCGSRYCIGVANGLDALKLILLGHDIGPGDEVIVPSNTYIATWLAVSGVGATLVPVEPDDDFNIDVSKIDEAVTKKTKAILVVHLYGRLCRMAEISALAERRNLLVFEDAAQSHGARCEFGVAGNLSDASAFSFYPGKNLGALGDGGAITTNNAILYDKLLYLRNYGSKIKYQNKVKGLNSRLDEIQAKFLSLKLPFLDADNSHRQKLAKRYYDILGNNPNVLLPPFSLQDEHVWHLFVIRVKEREKLSKYLIGRGIETMVHYPTAPHKQEAYGEMTSEWPIAEKIHDDVISLPIGPTMTLDEIDRVGDAVISFFGGDS
jgi:dTDP-4-amino-4,6-dideoxygalactose transaminase